MEFLNTKQLARLLGVQTVTIRRWIEKGELPAYKIGKELRVDKVDFENFVKERRVRV